MIQLTQSSLESAFKSEQDLDKTAAQIANDIHAQNYDISHFVETLGFALTSPNVDLRVNGTSLISLTLCHLPKDCLNAMQLEFIATFYADRIKDQHNVIPAVIQGIDALSNMNHLPGQSVTKLLQSLFQHTSCSSQVRNDRAKLYKIFKTLAARYEAELKSMSGDFIYGLINSIDGERDPRNLDFIFSFMPDVISRYPLLHLSEEMFEIFACYFPIDFNPSKNDPEAITRDALADKLTNCLVASPDFVEWTIALAIEKLESDLIVAKLDSLELLHQAALKFSPNLLVPHFEQIWNSIKTEIFPGTDNADVVRAGLNTLRSILEQAASDTNISHNYQTTILGVILPHLSDVNQSLFNPSTAIAFICVSGDPTFAAEKILNCFLLKLNELSNQHDGLNDEQRIKIYTKVAQVFKIAALRNACVSLGSSEICLAIHDDVIGSLRRDESEDKDKDHQNLDLKLAALSVLNESVPSLNEVKRALIYQLLLKLITSETIDLDFKFFLEQLGALHPIEMQTHCIDVCIANFDTYSSFVQRKIYANLLPLVKQMAFAQLILNLILTHVFNSTSEEVRVLSLKALNELLSNEDKRFVEDLQTNNCLIDKLIALTQSGKLKSEALEQAAGTLALIMQQLPLAEQYMIATEFLPKLNLQQEHDLYVAKGLLGFLHQEISLDDHFERLLDDLTDLSLKSENEQLRQVSHHLLCSMVNKIDYNDCNQSVVRKIIEKLKEAIKNGDAKAVELLAWVGKGLIVRGCADAGEIIEALAELLDHPSFTYSAKLAFEIISTEYPQLHLPVVKYLFKQKLFQMLLSKLGEKLEAYCEHHMNAFIYIIKTTPHAVLKLNLSKVGPILFKCLESQQMHTICIALEICENFIKHKDEYFRSHLNHIIPSCLQLAQYKESMKVRITALELLYDITKYPIFVLLPLKMDVVLELAHAVDDPKRLVRNTAVTARNAWFLIDSPNNET